MLSTIYSPHYHSVMTSLGSRRAAEAAALSRRLFQVVDRARTDFDAVAAGFGLTGQQARALLFLHEPRPMSDLADHLQCDRSNITGIADRLERAGAIDRVAGADRRVKLLRLTAAGEHQREQLAEAVSRGSTVMAKLNKQQRGQLAELLDALLAD
jgi:DNA-binding MarR family transcriptional regulator